MKHIKVNGNSKGTIVFIHGNSSSSSVYQDILNCNSIQQTKIAIELPGHKGNLDGFNSIDQFSIKSYCNELIPFVNSLEDDIILVGNSLGGHIAIEISEAIPRLKGLIIMGTPPVKSPLNMDEAFLPAPELQTFFTESPSNEAIESAAKACTYNGIHSSQIKDDFISANLLVRTAIASDAANNLFKNEYKIFTESKFPKFIIHGEFDPSVNLSYLKEVKENCKGTCELILLETCGHYPSLEKPEEFAATLDAIIQKTL